MKCSHWTVESGIHLPGRAALAPPPQPLRLHACLSVCLLVCLLPVWHLLSSYRKIIMILTSRTSLRPPSVSCTPRYVPADQSLWRSTISALILQMSSPKTRPSFPNCWCRIRDVVSPFLCPSPYFTTQGLSLQTSSANHRLDASPLTTNSQPHICCFSARILHPPGGGQQNSWC